MPHSQKRGSVMRRDLIIRLRLLDDAMPSAFRSYVRQIYRGLRQKLLRPRWGNLCRSGPFRDSSEPGYGTPIDHLYFAEFIDTNLDAIRGRVLEVGNRLWVDRAAAGQVTSVDVLDIDPNNLQATILGEPSDLLVLDQSSYDCVIMTRPVGYPSDPAVILETLWSALKPGGAILLSSPVIGPTNLENPDGWRFTTLGLQMLVERAIPAAQVSVCDFGSLATAIASIAGIPAEWVRKPALSWRDRRFPVVACARINRPAIGP